jgi:hypothetical protein
MPYTVVLRCRRSAAGWKLFSNLRLSCSHHHLTIKSAADCQIRLAGGPIGIGLAIGRWGEVEDAMTGTSVPKAELDLARSVDLDVAESFRIVLSLARQHIALAKTSDREHARQSTACAIVGRYVDRV